MTVKKRVLFVDDEPNLLNAIERMLHRQKSVWDMVFVTSVTEALEEVRKATPDLIVSDVMMPGRSGFDLLADLGSSMQTADIPVVIVTGALESDLKQRALDLGAADLLTKPIDVGELLARLRSVLRIQSYQDALKSQNENLERAVQERTQELESSRLDIIWRLGKAAEFRDDVTGNHVVRVACMCRLIAEALHMERSFVQMLFLASPLHDIGKMGIPDCILRKPGPLTSEESEIMKQHCTMGSEILRQDSKLKTMFQEWSDMRWPAGIQQNANPLLEMGSTIALTHHEKWDGSGYPKGLQGETIPIESRIVAICDVFDALRSDRPYHQALPEAEVLKIVREGVGRHFDPAVHGAFEEALSELNAIQHQISDEQARVSL